MSLQNEKEKLFKIIEFYYLSLISGLSYDRILNFNRDIIISKLEDFETSNSIFATQGFQSEALNHKPGLARFCIGCAYRGIFSAMYESISKNKDKTLLMELEKELNDTDHSFDGVIRFLRNAWSHQPDLVDIENIEVACQKQKGWNLKYRQGLPLSVNIYNNIFEIDLNNIQNQDKLLAVCDLHKQQIIIEWIYKYLKTQINIVEL